ncbi:hypothetical protein ACOSQ2_021638 [Xanthoceras sorbifolium]
MEDYGDVMTHLNNFNRCIKDDKAILLLRALPYSFKHFMITLLFGNDTLACDAVVSDIISYMKLNKTSEREAKEGLFFKESAEQG